MQTPLSTKSFWDKKMAWGLFVGRTSPIKRKNVLARKVRRKKKSAIET